MALLQSLVLYLWLLILVATSGTSSGPSDLALYDQNQSIKRRDLALYEPRDAPYAFKRVGVVLKCIFSFFTNCHSVEWWDAHLNPPLPQNTQNTVIINQQPKPKPPFYPVRAIFGKALTLEDQKLYPMGGPSPRIQLMDEFGRNIAKSNSGSVNIEAGHSRDYEMESLDKYPMPYYIGVTSAIEGGKKEKEIICLAAVAVGGLNGEGIQAIITGDLLVNKCQWPGYASSTIVNLDGEQTTPYCVYMSGGGYEDMNEFASLPQRLTFNLQSFSKVASAEAFTDDEDLLCKSAPRAWRWGRIAKEFPIFYPPLIFPDGSDPPNGTVHGKMNTAYDRNIINNPEFWKLSDGGKEPNFKPLEGIPELDLGPRIQPRAAGENLTELEHGDVFKYAAIARLFRGQYSTTNSSLAHDSAESRCRHAAFVGPDWINTFEGKYCDLEARRVFDFCETQEQELCWDDVEQEIRGERPSGSSFLLDLWSNGDSEQKPAPFKKLTSHFDHFDHFD